MLVLTNLLGFDTLAWVLVMVMKPVYPGPPCSLSVVIVTSLVEFTLPVTLPVVLNPPSELNGCVFPDIYIFLVILLSIYHESKFYRIKAGVST